MFQIQNMCRMTQWGKMIVILDEFELVENLCKYVILDDTNTPKHNKTKEYCLKNHNCIIESDDRNGWAAFETRKD